MTEFPEFSKLSFLSLNCHFRGRITKIIARMNSRILTNSLYIFDFRDFAENGHSDNGYFREKFIIIINRVNL